jgi:hypothetical protein
MPIKTYTTAGWLPLYSHSTCGRRTWEARFRLFLTLGRAELKSSEYMRSKETECRLTRRSSSRIRKVSSEQTILSDVACTAARSSGGRPRRCLERLRTPFDDHIRGFCRARATNNRTRQSEGTTCRHDAKEAGTCRTNNKACHRRAQLRRKRCCRRDRPMLFSGTNYKRPSMLCRSVRQALVNACQGSAGPQSCSHSLKVIEGRL